MKLKSLLLSSLVLYAFAFGISWILMQSPEIKDVQSFETDFGINSNLVAIPSSNFAYPVLTMVGGSYHTGQRPMFITDIKMDSLVYPRWSPSVYQVADRTFMDVYSLQHLNLWVP